MPNIIGLIPARAGSQRVPGKNIRPFGGHPLIAYTIAAARASGVFSRVIVSTDSPEVATAGITGRRCRFSRRRNMPATNRPTSNGSNTPCGDCGGGRRGGAFDSAADQPVPPAGHHQRDAPWAKFLSVPSADSLRAVELCLQATPRRRMWTLEGELMRPLLDDGGVNPPWHSTPYQALPVVYTQNASLEMAWTRVPLEQGTIAGRNVIPFLTEGHEGFDINKPNDWLLAELLLARGEAMLPSVSATSCTIAAPAA